MFYAQIITAYVCYMCKITFTLNNKLHQHIHFIHRKFKVKKSVSTILSSEPESKLNYIDVYVITDIIKLNTINIINESDCSFCNWHYITIFFQFSVKDFIKSVCLNTDCIMSLMNRIFLCKHLSDISIQKIKS